MAFQEKKSRASWQRSLLKILFVVLVLILAALLFASSFWYQKLSLLNRAEPEEDKETLSQEEIQEILSETEPADPEFTGPVISGDELDWEGEAEVITSGENIINILLIGQDKRGDQSRRQRSDAMILCTFNKSAKTITMTSFMRDMYVKIPGYGASKINHSYTLGGMKLLDQTLLENFGVQVDGNVEVDFNGFMEVIDLLGGVEIELTQEEATFLNRNGNWDVEEEEPDEDWNLTAGVNTLSGSQALAYSRIRYIGMDFERTQRQRNVLTALFGKVKDMSLLELNGLLDKVLPLVTTDLTNQQITSYVIEVAPLLLNMQMVNQRVPADDTWYFAKVDNLSVIMVNFAKNRELLAQTLGE